MSPPVWNPGAVPNVAMRRVESDDVCENPGDFYFTDIHPWADGAKVITPSDGTCPGYIFFVNNRGDNQCLPIRPHLADNGAGWEWDGNWDQPTMSPSVLTSSERHGQPFTIWHGYVRGGVVGFEC